MRDRVKPDILNDLVKPDLPSFQFRFFKSMSTLANETLLENIYDEVWVEYAKANNLTFDQLDALDQDSELGYLPEIANEAQKRFDDLCQ